MQQNVTFTSINQITSGLFNLNAVQPFAVGNGNCSGAYEYYAKVDVYQGSTYKGTYSLTLNSGQPSGSATAKSLAEFNAGLTTGVAYTFKLTTANCKGTFDLYYPTNSNQFVNYTVGGLRVKKITTHDGINVANDIIRNYDYNDPNTPTLSSGKLINKPQYIAAATYIKTVWENDNFQYLTVREARFKDSPQTPLSSFEGRHILYKNVKEYVTNNGQTEYLFDAVGLTNASFGIVYQGHCTEIVGVPYGMAYEPASGKVLQKTVKNSAGTVVLSEAYTYETGYTYAPGYAVKTENFMCDYHPLPPIGSVLEPWGTMAYMANMYQIRIGRHLLKQKTTVQDGVTTIVANNYKPTYIHHQPIATSITNSDGKIYSTYFNYIDSLPTSTLATKLSEYNLLLPALKTSTYNGSTLLSGSKFDYSFFTTTGSPTTSYATGYYPYPYLYYNYEMTFNSSGVPQAGIWELAGTVNTMNMSVARPATFTVANWQPETYEWETYGRLKKRIFGSFNWNYTYDGTTRLVKTVTNIDNQVTTYSYDALMRLSQGSARGGNVVSNYTYQYKNATNPYSYVNTRTTYTSVPNSSLVERESRQYLDGLGRLLQTVDKKYSPGQKDVIKAVAYDNLGRQYRIFEPFESANQTAAFVTPPATLKYTQTQYEPSPLGRAISVTPPSWYATTTAYGTNTTNEVKLNHTSNTYYATGALFKVTVTDPEGQQLLTYTDKKGRKVLERRRKTGNTDADTYFLYDDKDRPVTVIPPAATISNTNLIYTYEYDGANNILTKKIPDQDAVYYRYNSRDMVAFMQDGNMRFTSTGRWLQTSYDTYGRPLQTGFISNVSNPSGNNLYNIADLLSETCYDNGTGCAPVTGLQYMGKVRKTKVRVLDQANKWVENTFDYDVHGRNTYTNYSNSHLSSTGNTTMQYDWADNLTTQSRSLTAHAITTTTYNVNLYDHSGRHTGELMSVDGAPALTNMAQYNYDYEDQLKELNLGLVTVGSTSNWLQSVDYTYNQQGWLRSVNGLTSGTNIALNNCSAAPVFPNPGSVSFGSNPDLNDLFALNLQYDSVYSSLTGTTRKNGDISQMVWQVRGRQRQAYQFTYDYLSRLKTSVYYDLPDGSSFVPSLTNRYNETLNYDLRGNITSLARQGQYYNVSCWTVAQIDNLTYNYTSNTNKINTIAEAAPSTSRAYGFPYVNTSFTYTYDNNGNLKSDPYRQITLIEYNHLNLPKKITFTGNKTIEYQYDATGAKLRKTVTNNGTLQYTQDYVNGIEFRKNGTAAARIEAIYHNHGRVYNKNVDLNTTKAWQYEYYIKDHLGNVRLAFTDKNNNGVVDVTTTSTNEVLQENNYYAFGMSAAGPWMNDAARDNLYSYNGKELNTDFGLNWLDYGARWYDPSIGRWGQVDPLAEHPNQIDKSAFGYGWNNPVRYNDPDGKCPSCIVGGLVAGLVEYGSQVAVNYIQSGDFSLTRGIDFGDIALASGEGFVTSGTSIIKNVAVKVAVHVGAELARNATDLETTEEGDLKVQGKINTDKGVVLKTGIGLAGGAVGQVLPAAKGEFMKALSPKQAVKKARSEGPVNRSQRLKIEKEAKEFQITAKEINNTLNRSAGNQSASIASEYLKSKSDEGNK